MENTDNTLAWLSPEEFVMNRGAVDMAGRQSLASLNALGRQAMQATPNRYNKPNGIDYSVMPRNQGLNSLPRLGMAFDRGNGVKGNTGIPGVNRKGNSYSQAQGFKPSAPRPAPPTQGMLPSSTPSLDQLPRYQEGGEVEPYKTNTLAEIARSLSNVLQSYDQGQSPWPGGSAALNAGPAPKPQPQIKPQQQAQMQTQGAERSPFYANYKQSGNEVSFTGPDGQGQGQIRSNANLAQRMNDGKGSFSVMKLESPGGSEQPNENTFTPSFPQFENPDAPDYSAYAEDALRTLNAPRADSRFDSLSGVIGDKQRRQAAMAMLNSINDMSQTNSQASLGRQKINADTYQYGLSGMANMANAQNAAAKQAYDNQLNLQKYGLEAQNAATNKERLALDKQKSMGAVNRSNVELALNKLMTGGASDPNHPGYPKYKALLDHYNTMYNKKDLMAELQAE